MPEGIRDKVVILGMGCARFGERWDAGPEELMLEAFTEALDDAGIERDQIDAAWFGVFFDEQSVGKSALPLSIALRLPNIPVSRVENLCATGSETLRGAVYAVASGACDFALALGMEKLKDVGYRRAASTTCMCRATRLPAHSPSWPAPTPHAPESKWPT
jgi:acetyl-CoA C-acetyltransferase